MANPVFVDTSAWLAVADHTHRYHQEATRYYLHLIQRDQTLVTSTEVLTDAYVHMRDCAGQEPATRFRMWVEKAQRQGLLQVVPVSAEISRKGWDIFERHLDRLSSLGSCTSSVVAGRLGIRDVFTFASDFGALGFRVWPSRRTNGDNDLTD